jgi:hypothetical protein
MYVFQFTMNEIRLTESGLGDCLVLMHVFFFTVLSLPFMCRIDLNLVSNFK